MRSFEKSANLSMSVTISGVRDGRSQSFRGGRHKILKLNIESLLGFTLREILQAVNDNLQHAEGYVILKGSFPPVRRLSSTVWRRDYWGKLMIFISETVLVS